MWVGLLPVLVSFAFGQNSVFTFSTGEQLIVSESSEGPTFTELREPNGKMIVRLVGEPLFLPVQSKVSAKALSLAADHSLETYVLDPGQDFAILCIEKLGTLLLRPNGSFLKIGPPKTHLKVIPLIFQGKPSVLLDSGENVFLFDSTGLVRTLGNLDLNSLRAFVDAHDPKAGENLRTEQLRGEAELRLARILQTIVLNNLTRVGIPSSTSPEVEGAESTAADREAFRIGIATFGRDQLDALVGGLSEIETSNDPNMTAIFRAFANAKNVCNRVLSGPKNPLLKAS